MKTLQTKKSFMTSLVVLAAAGALSPLAGAQTTNANTNNNAANSAAIRPSEVATDREDMREDMNDAVTHVNTAIQTIRKMENDRGMAQLLKNAKGVFVVPDYGRAALGVGARGGAGVLLVRQGNSWSNPAFYNMGGISAGLQAGAEAGEIALVLNNQKALNSFMQGNKFSLNAGAGLTLVNWSAKAQGSAGRGDVTVWSDTEGLFGGATLSVTDIDYDENETSAYYKRRVAARDVLMGKVSNPQAAQLRQAIASAANTNAAKSMGSSATGTTSASGTTSHTGVNPRVTTDQRVNTPANQQQPAQRQQ